MSMRCAGLSGHSADDPVCGRPRRCKHFSNGLVHAVRCCRVSGLSIAAVYRPQGLHGDTRIKGDRAGQWSVRVSGNWRVVFRFEDGEAVDVDPTNPERAEDHAARDRACSPDHGPVLRSVSPFASFRPSAASGEISCAWPPRHFDRSETVWRNLPPMGARFLRSAPSGAPVEITGGGRGRRLRSK